MLVSWKKMLRREQRNDLMPKKEIYEGFSPVWYVKEPLVAVSPETVGALKPALASRQVIITFPCGTPAPPLLSHSGTRLKSDCTHTAEWLFKCECRELRAGHSEQNEPIWLLQHREGGTRTLAKQIACPWLPYAGLYSLLEKSSCSWIRIYRCGLVVNQRHLILKDDERASGIKKKFDLAFIDKAAFITREKDLQILLPSGFPSVKSATDSAGRRRSSVSAS